MSETCSTQDMADAEIMGKVLCVKSYQPGIAEHHLESNGFAVFADISPYCKYLISRYMDIVRCGSRTSAGRCGAIRFGSWVGLSTCDKCGG